MFKIFRKKKNVSRNERVEKYSNNSNRLRMTLLKGMVPRLALGVVFIVVCVLLLPPTQRVHELRVCRGLKWGWFLNLSNGGGVMGIGVGCRV